MQFFKLFLLYFLTMKNGNIMSLKKPKNRFLFYEFYDIIRI